MIDLTQFMGLETSAADEPPAPISERARDKWRHLQIVDGRHFVDGESSTKARYDGMAQRAKKIEPAWGGGDWALVKPGVPDKEPSG